MFATYVVAVDVLYDGQCLLGAYEDMEREPYEASRSTETASEQSAPASASEQEQGSSAAQNESPAAASPAAPAPTRNAIIETDDEVLE